MVLGLAVRAGALGPERSIHVFALRHADGRLRIAARTVTVGGTWVVVVPVVSLALLAVLARHGRSSAPAVGVMVIGALTALEARLVLSVAVGRPRPEPQDWVTPASGYAYPSGHTAAATVAAALCVWAVHQLTDDRRTRALVWCVALPCALAVGWSRVWLGVHWPLDVVGGFGFGGGWMLATVALAAAARSSGRPGGDDHPRTHLPGSRGTVAVDAGFERHHPGTDGLSLPAVPHGGASPGEAVAGDMRPSGEGTGHTLASVGAGGPGAGGRGGWLGLVGSAGVRTRLAMAAAAVMAATLSVAMLGSWWLLQRSLTQAATDDVAARVAAIASDVGREGLTATDLDHRPLYGEVVQVLGTGDIVLAAAPGSARDLDLDLSHPSPGRTTIRRVSALPQSGADEPYVLAARAVRDPDGREVVVVVGRSEAGVQETIGAVGKLGLGLLPLLVLLTGAATYWFTGRALLPVELIRRRVSAISSHRLDERVPVPIPKDEVGRLARTMNDMLARLEASQSAQRRFVADAGHELRSPLATMSVTLDVARAEHLVAPEHADLLNDLQAETDRMSRLVDDLLLLARADERSLPLRLGDVDLDELVENEVRRLLAGHADRLHFEVRTTPTRLRADRDRMQQVLRNLLDNATRHALSTVEVRLEQRLGTVTLTVADDGPGIPVADRSRVFDRFVRLDNARDRDSGGSGLGLAIVHEIVTAHAGTVAAREAAGGGALFDVRLPLSG